MKKTFFILLLGCMVSLLAFAGEWYYEVIYSSCGSKATVKSSYRLSNGEVLAIADQMEAACEEAMSSPSSGYPDSWTEITIDPDGTTASVDPIIDPNATQAPDFGTIP